MDLLTTLQEMQNLEADCFAYKQVAEAEIEPIDDVFKSQFAALYKTNAKPLLSQAARREELLKSITIRRCEAFDQQRDFTDLFDDIEEFECDDTEPEPMDVVKKPWKKKRRRRNLRLKGKLTFAEWFTEIPTDLETNWFFKLCPQGIRNLIVAYQNKTKAFNKNGKWISCFKSYLPGGGLPGFHNRYTVLDCVFNVKKRCYFILDVLAWNSCSLMDSSTEMRFYWLKSKLSEELPKLQESTPENPFPFYEVNFYPSELPIIEEKLSQPYDLDDIELHLDGILFYHREVNYIEGKTPLVGWLHPYMIPEKLNIPICDTHTKKKPNNYVCMEEYLRERKLKQTNIKVPEKMDC